MSIEQSRVSHSLPDATRMATLKAVSSNVRLHDLLFTDQGLATERLKQLLATLKFKDSHGTLLHEQRSLTHHTVEEVLQECIVKSLMNKFSYEVAPGVAPTPEQLEILDRLGLVAPIALVDPFPYDVGIVFGGLLEACCARVRNLISQDTTCSVIALFGSERELTQAREVPDQFVKTLGQDYVNDLYERNEFPKTEAAMMRCVWDKLVQGTKYQDAQVIVVNSKLRTDEQRAAPGAIETVQDFREVVVSSQRLPGLTVAPTRFLLSSSQPHGIRQLADFLSSYIVPLRYPQQMTVDVVAYKRSATSPTSLLLYLQELGKLVHSQYTARYPSK